MSRAKPVQMPWANTGACVRPIIPVLSLHPLRPAPSQILLIAPQKWLPHWPGPFSSPSYLCLRNSQEPLGRNPICKDFLHLVSIHLPSTSPFHLGGAPATWS